MMTVFCSGMEKHNIGFESKNQSETDDYWKLISLGTDDLNLVSSF